MILFSDGWDGHRNRSSARVARGMVWRTRRHGDRGSPAPATAWFRSSVWRWRLLFASHSRRAAMKPPRGIAFGFSQDLFPIICSSCVDPALLFCGFSVSFLWDFCGFIVDRKRLAAHTFRWGEGLAKPRGFVGRRGLARFPTHAGCRTFPTELRRVHE